MGLPLLWSCGEAHQSACPDADRAARDAAYATVQLLLGHNSIQTTIRAYCGLEQGDAIKRYDAYRKLCLSEIKLGRTGGEVHRGMAWVRSGRRRERDAETEHPC